MNMNKVYCCFYESPLGTMLLESDGETLTGLTFMDERSANTAEAQADIAAFSETIRWLDRYFGGDIPEKAPRCQTNGTAFQERVWQIVSTIPYGQTMSYGEIAQIIAKERGIRKMAAQAVGNAVGSNPISLIIPCHRVIGSNGSLVGYGSGLDRKYKLLEMEQNRLSNQNIDDMMK